MTEKLITILSNAAEQLGIELTDNQKQLLISYVLQLHKWNQAYNLSAIRDIESILQRHVIDSLSIINYLNTDVVNNNAKGYHNSVADIGSGAGLPGIVIAIIKPETQVFLVESINKKCRFLRHIATYLQLSNIQIINERVENWQPNQFINTIICRAFTDLEHFIKITSHLATECLVKNSSDSSLSTTSTQWFAMKSAHTKEEELNLQKYLTNLDSLESNDKEIQHYEYKMKNLKLFVPFENADRHLIILTRSKI